MQAIRVLGLLGTLDPYKHKLNRGQIDMMGDSGAVLSESKAEDEPSLGEVFTVLISCLHQIHQLTDPHTMIGRSSCEIQQTILTPKVDATLFATTGASALPLYQLSNVFRM